MNADAEGSVPLESPIKSPLDNCWVQLLTGIMAMVAIANLQYGWTLFVDPIHQKYHWTEKDIQWAFTLFVLMETWLVPLECYLVDRFGANLFVAIGGLLVGLAWVLNSWADTLPMLYLAGGLGGVGAGVVYGTSIGNALKWFPHRRGLAAGLTSAAFGAGSALTVMPINNMIRQRGYEDAFLYFGIGQGFVVLVCALLLRHPPETRRVFVKSSQLGPLDSSTANEGMTSAILSRLDAPMSLPAGSTALTENPQSQPLSIQGQNDLLTGKDNMALPVKVQQTGRDFTWTEMIRAPAFWLMYVMFTMVATGGLMAVAQLGPMARDFQVAQTPVNFFGFTALALPLAMSLDRILNGLTRPFFGWISDHLGRENTMFVAFGLEGCAIFALLQWAHLPMMFVLLTGMVFFAWGEIYSLFPALCGDLFGRKFASTNYGLLYTAKGTAALLVPYGSYLAAATGSWQPIFFVAIGFDWSAALLALLVLKPLRARWLARQHDVGIDNSPSLP